MSINFHFSKRIAISITAGLGLLSVALVWIFSSFEDSRLENALWSDLKTFTELQSSRISEWRNERISDGRFLNKSAFVMRSVEAYLTKRDIKSRAEVYEWAETLIGGNRYESIAILDPARNIALLLGSTTPIIDATMSDIITTAGSRNLVQLTDTGFGNSKITLVVPITKPPLSTNILGYVLLTIDPNNNLFPSLASSTDGKNAYFRPLLAKQSASSFILFDIANRKTITFNRSTDGTIIDLIKRGKKGMFPYNENGISGTACITSVKDTSLFFVTTITEDDIEKHLTSRNHLSAKILLISITLSSVLVGIIIGQLYRAKTLREAILAKQSNLQALETANNALLESEKRFRDAMGSAPDAMMILRDGTILEANPTANALFGATGAKGLVGMRTSDLVAPESKDHFYDSTLSTEPTSSRELECIKLSGQRIDVEFSTAPLVYNRALSALVFVRDVTEKKNAVRILRHSENRLRLLGAALEAAANAIVITNSKGFIIWANQAFSEMSQWPIAEAIGRDTRTLLKSGHQKPEFYKNMWETILAGRVWRGELVNKRRNGEEYTEDMTITPVRDVEGTISHFIAIKEDVTKQKSIEAQLRNNQRIEAIGTLAGGVAHDINNILTPILLFCEMLIENSSISEKDKQLIEMAYKEAKRGGDITRQLLLFSRGAEKEKVPIDPLRVVKDLINMVSETFPREIAVVSQIRAPLHHIIGDSTQLYQVLLNLCVNARDAMPNGGKLTIASYTITIIDGDPLLQDCEIPGQYVAFQITDTGTGMDDDVRQRIFDPFFTTKPVGKGTGLGLSTVLGIVKSHKGFIRVQSAVQSGSQFTCYFPAVESVETTVTLEPPTVTVENLTILVAEDEPTIREAEIRMLKRFGHEVIAAKNGEEALEMFIKNRNTINIVITDVMMPVMNGVSLAKSIRLLDPMVPVIAATGMDEDAIHKDITHFEFCDTISKPFTKEMLLAKIQKVWANRNNR